MRIPRIYTSQTLAENGDYQLEAGPSQHLCRALRMGPGDSLMLFDGTGGQYAATITEAGKKSVSVRTGALRATNTESPLPLHLGIAVSRGERMDWVVQKASELGVTEITPLFTARVEVKLAGERAQKKLRHWQQVAISACEQSGRDVLPTIHAPSSVSDWLSDTHAECKLVLHHRADTGERNQPPENVALLVGPEGGLSADEITAAEQAGFQSLRLGPRVLRTETAPLAAIAIVQARWGDMAS